MVNKEKNQKKSDWNFWSGFYVLVLDYVIMNKINTRYKKMRGGRP